MDKLFPVLLDAPIADFFGISLSESLDALFIHWSFWPQEATVHSEKN